MEHSINTIDPDTFDLLTQNKMFNGFTEDEISKIYILLNPLRICVPKGTVIISAGDDAEFMWIICDGTIMASDTDENNDQQILDLHERGEYIGLDAVMSSFATSPLTFTAIVDSELLRLDIGCLLSGSFDTLTVTKMFLNINRIIATKCVNLQIKTAILSTRSLRARIMSYLRIQMSEQGTTTVKINMDRKKLALYLCVNRSALSRELGNMQRDELITLEADGIIKVKFPVLAKHAP